jgi:hypothetical protein
MSNHRRWFAVITLLLAGLLLSGCNLISSLFPHPREDLDGTVKQYTQMLRWGELDRAAATFPDPCLRLKFEASLLPYRLVKIVDVRIKLTELSRQDLDAVVKVEWDYYRPPSVKVLTVEDLQRWTFIDDEDVNFKGWELISPLPPLP